MLSMTKEQRREFIDWRNPQYQGPFSCRNGNSYWTWIPSVGIVPAFSSIAQKVSATQEVIR